MSVKKGDVRSNFRHARFLMQEAEKIMKNSKSIENWEESSEAGQIALELIASVAIFEEWVAQNN
jgi:5-bromo-4-chloroindolyl phosphate hydrolysis protein